MYATAAWPISSLARARAWVETRGIEQPVASGHSPARGRGLKLHPPAACSSFRSHSPARGRGLKRTPRCRRRRASLAPARAWVETRLGSRSGTRSRHSPARGRGLKLRDIEAVVQAVTRPRAGVGCNNTANTHKTLSSLARARAWVETRPIAG